MSFDTPQKRKERAPVGPQDTPSPRGQTPKRPKPCYDTAEKLDQIFSLLHSLDWTLGDFLFHTFAHQDEKNTHIPRSIRHGAIVHPFLAGLTTHTVAEIIQSWLTSPDGRGFSDDTLFQTDVPYLQIKPVRQALIAFAAQQCGLRLGQEVRRAVKPESGLHAKVSMSQSALGSIEWSDLGTSIRQANQSLQTVQRLAVYLMNVIAEPTPRSRKGLIVVRKSRPRENVVTTCLSMLDFCKNDEARLIPLARGILYLSSCVPIDIISYNSRIAGMPAVNTIKHALKGFSDQKAIAIRQRGRNVVIVKRNGRNMTKVKVLIFDNVQHFMRERDLRIGRENRMIIGIACTFWEFWVDEAALDVLDKRARITSSSRPQITVDDVLGMIDQPHMKQIGILQFLEALTNYIPDASIYKDDIYLRYRTRVAKLQAEVVAAPISPLATSGKNEASISELKDAFLDFLEQLGMQEDDYDLRLFFGGGDGMSYNNMLLLKKYLQNHKDPFQSFEILHPVLQLWHTMWTDLSRIFETHWGAPLNDNPATLGHSAKKIGRAAPANLKKVDYYPSAQLLNLVHDMRMLDCWSTHFNTDDIFEYFAALGRLDKLPSFEELELAAKKLFETYVVSGARYQVRLDARDEATSGTVRAPLGDLWAKPRSTKLPPKKTAKPKPLPPPPLEFFGDQVLFDNGTFMHDAMISREVAAAAAQGAVGRVWEGLKVMVFTFAGSTHSKYTNYLLEMIVDLELESNRFLKDATLLSTVLNPDGTAGKFKPCDIFQELLNRCIDPIVQRKDADYGSNHVRNIWSRNIKDIYELKTDFRAGVGLAERSGKHKKPHERPEVKTLYPENRSNQLSKRRPGRTYEDGRDVDNFGGGINNLGGGTLTKWAKRTSNARVRYLNHGADFPTTQPTEESDHESDWDDDSEDEERVPMTMGSMRYEDG
ncbi:hypothetical protein C8J57DRAFT_1068065 [Mycena rebaudengoi]|nr:hypothetical protein C8J57DRAFT_1068065 [Mycena rebaudengoi]